VKVNTAQLTVVFLAVMLLGIGGSVVARLWGTEFENAVRPGDAETLPLDAVAEEYPGAGAPGELEVQAIAQAYPDIVSKAAYLEGDWAVRIDGIWFFFAEGRMLPESERENFRNFTSIRFYNYTPGPFKARVITEETAERLRSRSARAEPPPPRHNAFLDSLYQITTRRDAERQIGPHRFLGRSAQVHQMLVGPLQRVEQDLVALSARDAEVREFITGLHQISGFLWRNIAGTQSRSYHGYGVAVDLIPRSYERRWGYWRWAMNGGVAEWWNIPAEQRWSVPDAVLEVFERHGFVWGGKWLSFDPIHFEYRPEVLLLSKLRAEYDD